MKRIRFASQIENEFRCQVYHFQTVWSGIGRYRNQRVLVYNRVLFTWKLISGMKIESLKNGESEIEKGFLMPSLEIELVNMV